MRSSGLIAIVVCSGLGLLPSCGDDGGTAAIADAATNHADASVSANDAIAGGADANPALLGTLRGTVVRTVAPSAGGVGNLFIALFDQDPVTSPSPPPPIGQLMLENVDMSGDGAAIPYQLSNLTPRATPYYIVAFLDDNHNASMDPATAGPDMGDLVSLNGLASPSVVIDQPGIVEQTITLNLAMPF